MTKAVDEKIEAINLTIKADMIGSTYAHVVGVSLTENDLTLEFVYINPRNKTEGQLVSRVTMPREAGGKIIQGITDVTKAFESMREGKK